MQLKHTKLSSENMRLKICINNQLYFFRSNMHIYYLKINADIFIFLDKEGEMLYARSVGLALRT